MRSRGRVHSPRAQAEALARALALEPALAAAQTGYGCARLTALPPTKWTRRVPHPVLIGRGVSGDINQPFMRGDTVTSISLS